MTQQLQVSNFEEDWKLDHLPGVLAGDIAAATISATAISPLITAIDR